MKRSVLMKNRIWWQVFTSSPFLSPYFSVRLYCTCRVFKLYLTRDLLEGNGAYTEEYLQMSYGKEQLGRFCHSWPNGGLLFFFFFLCCRKSFLVIKWTSSVFFNHIQYTFAQDWDKPWYFKVLVMPESMNCLRLPS